MFLVHNLLNDEIYHMEQKNYIYNILSKYKFISIGYARKSTNNQKSISEQHEIKKKAKEDGINIWSFFIMKEVGGY